MGALLISGVCAPRACAEIPLGGMGLDGKTLHASDGRFHDARRILKTWRGWDDEDEAETKPSEFPPGYFFNWCDEEDIDTHWQRLFVSLLASGKVIA